MGTPYRCRRCGTRHTFPQPVYWYKRRPKCRLCHARDFRLDQYMLKRQSFGCRCGAYAFPHRPGGGRCTNETSQYRHLTPEGYAWLTADKENPA